MAARVSEDESSDLVTVESRKFDGRLGRTWRARLIRHEGSLVVLDGGFEEEVSHEQIGTILCGTRSVEFYWTDRWYSVFRFSEPTGELKCLYCNINSPVTFDGSLLTFTDLDIDVLVMPDFTHRVLDLDEFEENAATLGYPAELRANVFAALDELRTLIVKREFPFDTFRDET